MFRFLLKYSLKETTKNYSAVFWVLAFPFILATIFGFVFGKLDENKMKLDPVPIMIEDEMYAKVFREIKMEGKPIFEILAYQEPKIAMKDGKINGFLEGKGRDVKVSLKQGSLYSVIIYNVANQINHSFLAVEEIVKKPENFEKLENLANDIAKSNEINIANGMEGKNKKRAVSYFYSLLAMICLGGMTFGVYSVESSSVVSDVKAARRRLVSPVSRAKFILSDVANSLIVSTGFSLILFVYIRYGWRIDFGDNAKVVVGILLGNLMAILLGMLVALIFKGKSDTKVSIAASFYVFSSALSGMMVSDLAGFINHRAPILNHINPGTVITKLFTSLYLYEDGSRYFLYLYNLIIYILVSFLFVLFLLRRRNYDSI